MEEEPAPSAQDISLDVESFLSGYFLTEDADDSKVEDEAKEEEEGAEKQHGQVEPDAVAAADEGGGGVVSVVQDSESLHTSSVPAAEQKPPLSRMRPAPLMVGDSGSGSLPQKAPLEAAPDSATPKWALDSSRAQRPPSGARGRMDKASPAAVSQHGKQIRPRREPTAEPEGDGIKATIGVEPEDTGLRSRRRRMSRSVSSGLLVSECGTDDFDFSGPPSSKMPGLASRSFGSQQELSHGSYGYERRGGSGGGSHPVRLRPPVEPGRPVRGSSYPRSPFDREDHSEGGFIDRGRLQRSAPDVAYPPRAVDSRVSPSLTDSSLIGNLRKPPPAGAYSDPDSDPDDRDSVAALRRRRLPPPGPGRDEDRRTTPSATPSLPVRRNRDELPRYVREEEPLREEHIGYDRGGGADRGRDRRALEMSRGRYIEDEDDRAFKRPRGSRDEYEGPSRRATQEHRVPEYRADPDFRRARPEFQQEEAPRYREDIPVRRSPSPPRPLITGRRNSPPRRPLDGWSERRPEERRPEERTRHDSVRDIRPSGAPGGRRMSSPVYLEDRDRARPWQYQGGRGRRG